jgi:hypothetical protein
MQLAAAAALELWRLRAAAQAWHGWVEYARQRRERRHMVHAAILLLPPKLRADAYIYIIRSRGVPRGLDLPACSRQVEVYTSRLVVGSLWAAFSSWREEAHHARLEHSAQAFRLQRLLAAGMQAFRCKTLCLAWACTCSKSWNAPPTQSGICIKVGNNTRCCAGIMLSDEAGRQQRRMLQRSTTQRAC